MLTQLNCEHKTFYFNFFLDEQELRIANLRSIFLFSQL